MFKTNNSIKYVYITADRDARRSDGSNEYKGVRQQYITEY